MDCENCERIITVLTTGGNTAKQATTDTATIRILSAFIGFTLLDLTLQDCNDACKWFVFVHDNYLEWVGDVEPTGLVDSITPTP